MYYQQMYYQVKSFTKEFQLHLNSFSDPINFSWIFSLLINTFIYTFNFNYIC